MADYGDRVMLKESARVADETRKDVGGKVGIVQIHDEYFDWVVKFDGTRRKGGLYGFNDCDLHVVERER